LNRKDRSKGRSVGPKQVLAIIISIIVGAAVGFGVSYVGLVSPLRAELDEANSKLANYEASLKPNFNVYNFQRRGNNIAFSVQNIGSTDAHNVTVTVNGAWIPSYNMSVTSVEHGYIDTPEHIATVFNGTIRNYTADTTPRFDDYVRRLGIQANGSETDYSTYLKITVEENGTLRYLTDNENEFLVESFGDPIATYTYNETTISVLAVAETKALTVDLQEWAESYQIAISCSETEEKTFIFP
jgi:archaellum component FlaG (FlaF/FlaG flagellin family)